MKKNENAQRLVRLLTTTAWIENPKPLTKREQDLYVAASRCDDVETAKFCARNRVALCRTERGVLYGSDMWTDTAGHEDDFGYIPYNLDEGHTVLDCPLTMAIEAMDDHNKED